MSMSTDAKAALALVMEGNIGALKDVGDHELIGMTEALATTLHSRDGDGGVFAQKMRFAHGAVHLELLSRMRQQ